MTTAKQSPDLTTVELLYSDGSRDFWWAQCSVDGCGNRACLSANSDKCHPHTFTKFHHKIMRLIRRLLP